MSDGKKKNHTILELQSENMTYCDRIQYLCDICDNVFREDYKLINHNIYEHGLTRTEMTFDCGICFQSFTEKSSFAQHIQTKQKENYSTANFSDFIQHFS